jgi:TolB-like protein/tRNA A-37 threonylcarbamoyl transferase component Bud32/tetratricopeptide (TPR) repeat protein
LGRTALPDFMTEPTSREQLQASLGTAFTIQRELGGGGMSRIYLARDEALERDIVIKVLPRELAAEMSAERFAREIKLAAALQHPHVLPVLSAGSSNGLPYYTMPFVRGESLRTAMDKKQLSLEEALGLLRDIARALRYAHGEGVVHRDIKPENILLSSGSAVVVDFGIAKALSASRTEAPGGTLTLVGTSIGTPAYMSPEQAAADPNIDHRADIYAWGVIAYELLSRRHPFEGKTTPQQYLKAHLSESPPLLKSVAPAVPAAVATVVMRALEKEPGDRPQSADEVLQQLGGTSTSGPVTAPRRESSVWRTVSIAGAALVLLGIGLVVWKGKDAQAEAPIMLAVLPFENQGPSEQEYFVDGLADAVNGKLAGISGISVIDRRSTIAYRKTTKPVKQIGTELGVQYVLGAVVRWAPGDSGLRAQVRPTLVDTRDATTKWAGDPIVVSSSDPFTAQTEIASKVVDALQVALGATDKRDLAERPTNNTEAYDAYLRGVAVFESVWKASMSIRSLDQAIADFERAVALDPKFAQAWGMLAITRYGRSEEVAGDTTSVRLAKEAARRAAALDPNDPVVVSVRSGITYMEGDLVRARKIVSDAVNAGIIDVDLLLDYAFDLVDTNPALGDSADKVVMRAVRMSPREARILGAAARIAAVRRDWVEWRKRTRAQIALDPTDERGWAALAQRSRSDGDTVEMRRVIKEALQYIPSPSNLLLVSMVYAGNELGSRFIRMTPEQLRIETLYDSVSSYHDNKADYFLRIGNMVKARASLDSIISQLKDRNLSGRVESDLRLYLANAYAQTGRTAEAAAELERARNAARAANNLRKDGSPDLNPRVVAAILGALGRYDEAISELRLLMTEGTWMRAGIALEPKMRTLRGNPKYEAFLRERPQ